MKTVAFANARGGVGKTSLACATAIALAELEHKVLLFDGDLSLANLDVHLGLRPAVTLKHVVCDAIDLESTVTQGPAGVSVICGGSGVKELASIDPELVAEIVRNLGLLDRGFDHIVIDTGSGIHETPMAFLLAADVVVLVCTPDPTSVMDAYATVKLLFEQKPDADVRLLVNMADDDKSGAIVYARFKSIIGQFLNKEVPLAGIVCYDKAVKSAGRERCSFLESAPRCKASISIKDIARTIVLSVEEGHASAEIPLLQRMRSTFSFLSKVNSEGHQEEEVAEVA